MSVGPEHTVHPGKWNEAVSPVSGSPIVSVAPAVPVPATAVLPGPTPASTRVTVGATCEMVRSEERRVGKRVDLGGGGIPKKKMGVTVTSAVAWTPKASALVAPLVV